MAEIINIISIGITIAATGITVYIWNDERKKKKNRKQAFGLDGHASSRSHVEEEGY